jgi:hypothetical protein
MRAFLPLDYLLARMRNFGDGHAFVAPRRRSSEFPLAAISACLLRLGRDLIGHGLIDPTALSYLPRGPDSQSLKGGNELFHVEVPIRT